MKRVVEEWSLELGNLRPANAKIFADVHLDGSIVIVSVVAKLKLMSGSDPYLSLDVRELLTTETKMEILKYIRSLHSRNTPELDWVGEMY